jgi:hypothetical protein
MAAEPRSTSGDFSSRQFWPMLRHALSECLLIIMLFVTALVSYSATKLARTCRLRSPCILCSRLDRLLHGKAWFSEELVCAAHRLEIARLSYCQSHQKLVHPDDICDRCHRSCIVSIGKTANLKNISVEEKVNSQSRSRHADRCSCCSVSFKKTHNAHKLSEIASVGHSSDDGSDHLPSEGYRKLKLQHDSESEIDTSHDDDDDDDDVQMPPLVSSDNSLSMLPSENTVITNSMKPMNTANRQSSDNKVDNFAKSSDRSIGQINWSQIKANDNKNDMQLKAMPEQLCAELPKEKSMYVIKSVVILI